MQEFLIGRNYWSYNSGGDMWRDWDEEQVEKDFKLISLQIFVFTLIGVIFSL